MSELRSYMLQVKVVVSVSLILTSSGIYIQYENISNVVTSILEWGHGEEAKRERESNRELNHYSNVINDSPICMRWTINHSQVSVTDRRLAFSVANRMNFDNINGIPLFFPALIHCAACVCAWMCVCVALSAGCRCPFGYQTIAKICSPIYRGGKKQGGQKRRREGRA